MSKVLYSLRIDTELLTAVRAAAAEKGCTTTQFVLSALEDRVASSVGVSTITPQQRAMYHAQRVVRLLGGGG